MKQAGFYGNFTKSTSNLQATQRATTEHKLIVLKGPCPNLAMAFAICNSEMLQLAKLLRFACTQWMAITHFGNLTFVDLAELGHYSPAIK